MLYCTYFAEYVLYLYISPKSRTGNPLEIWEEDHSGDIIGNNYIPVMIVKRRVSGRIICRLWTIPPKLEELFYLRILLLHKYGRSFHDIRTIGGIEYPTFQEAAKALDLFENENEGIYALQEGLHLLYHP